MAQSTGLSGNWQFPRHHADLTLPFPGPSRCFPFWQELLSCYVINSTEDDDSGKKKCVPAMEDYYECLHHRKEVRRPVANQFAQLADPDYLLSRLPESRCCRPPTARRRPRSCKRIPLQPVKYGISDCSTRRTIPRRCWGRARAVPSTLPPQSYVYIRLLYGGRHRSGSEGGIE